MSASTLTDFACPFCGCLCDDIQLTVEGQRIARVRNACALGEQRFVAAQTLGPPATIAGRPVSVDEAIEKAAAILAGAQSPLIFGLSALPVDAQRTAVALAELLGASIDPGLSVEEREIARAIQDEGLVTCTLGEVKNRADLVLCWRCDPARTHPRLLSRYVTETPGLFRPQARAERTIVVVDEAANETAREADLALSLPDSEDVPVFWMLRLLLRGAEVPAEMAAGTGLSLAQWEDLLTRLRQARFWVLFLDGRLASGAPRACAVRGALALVRELNAVTQFRALVLRPPGNGAGAENVLCWQTGYAGPVSFHHGFPQSNGSEFSAERVLARREADAALFFAAGEPPVVSEEAQRHLEAIPRVTFSAASDAIGGAATVAFRVATPGIDAAGIVFRMDGLCVPLRRAIEPAHLPAKDLLERLLRRLGRSGAQCP